jgi:hypothetical protein
MASEPIYPETKGGNRTRRATMASTVTLQQVEELVSQLPPNERLKLAARICEELSTMPCEAPAPVDEEQLRRERIKKAEEILARCDAAAAMTLGEFDSAEEIRQMRAERDEQILPAVFRP